MADNYFASVPASVRFDKSLSSLDRNVYVEISARSNSKGYCWPKNKTLADLLSVRIETISRSINRLIHAGHVIAGNKEGVRFLRVALDPTINTLDPTINTLDPTIKVPCVIDQGDLDPTINQKKSEEKKEKRRRREQPVCVDHDFDRFWETYPKKAGKLDALKAWDRAKKNGLPDIETLIETVSFWKTREKWTKDNGQYIPHPATWLNAGRWDDDQTNEPEDWDIRSQRVMNGLRSKK